MNVLLHSCCAPCANQCVDFLRREGHDLALFWYNPNIHPFTEHRARLGALRDYAQRVSVPLAEGGGYGLRSFLAQTAQRPDDRCATCYAMRMQATAQYAADNGYDAFSTSLLISPYQDHEQIQAIATEAADAHGVRFFYHDFRPYFRAGQQAARDGGLYMQKYCGCIFSEEERYAKKNRKET